MLNVRVAVEWILKKEEGPTYWAMVDYKHKMRIGECPVGALYLAAMLLMNLRSYVYPNSITKFFNYALTYLESYLKDKYWLP